MHRDNHYVPRSYLKRWTSDGHRVWAYRVLVPHENVQGWRKTSIRGIAYHEHLYTRVAASGESDELERWLDAEFEAPAEDAIARAVANKSLSRHDWRLLVRFFAAQDVRTPARLLENMKRWASWLPDLIQRTATESVAKLEAMSPSERAALADKAASRDDLPFRVTTEQRPGESGGWLKGETIAGRGLWLWSMRHLLSGEPLEALCRHRWTILAPPDGLTWFTSDDPVLKVNFKSLQDYNFGGGWGSVGTDLFLPLSPQHMLYTQIGRPVPPRGAKLDLEKATIVRRLIAEHAHRYIFASDPEPLVSDLRPRTVDAGELKREQTEWASWHTDQTDAEGELMGW
jgi:Protein of unknown function (DUF4238)